MQSGRTSLIASYQRRGLSVLQMNAERLEPDGLDRNLSADENSGTVC